jgi:hypothetical protein
MTGFFEITLFVQGPNLDVIYSISEYYVFNAWPVVNRCVFCNTVIRTN